MSGLAVVQSRTLRGLDAPEVRVEVHLSNGLPLFTIVGLPEAAVRESRERVRAALIQTGFDFPQRRIAVNLAPADLPKDSGRFDLPIAIGILCADGRLPQAALNGVEFAGELSLTGALRPIVGALALACGLKRHDSTHSLVLPFASAREATHSRHPRVHGARDLAEVCAHLLGRQRLAPLGQADTSDPGGSDAPIEGERPHTEESPPPDLADVVGQPQACRALEIAAAGRHHLLLDGAPGMGKSMLSARLPGIMPRLDDDQALQVASLASLRRLPVDRLPSVVPMRSPHHSVSVAGLLGGGQPPRPGEISLAHHGVLFLDELPEFRRSAIEALREPLETGAVTVARGPYQETFPASFLLVAAMNPCPCGYLGDARHACRCTPDRIRRYRAKLSGPLLDRFDLAITVSSPAAAGAGAATAAGSGMAPSGANSSSCITTAAVRHRVWQARRRQLERQRVPNGLLGPAGLSERVALAPAAERLARQAMARFGWSMRGLHRIYKVSRTIADLAASAQVGEDAVAEAVALRRHLDAAPAAE
ncbi:MAG: YifB family Mg chelatase-like AAA ATPase [Lautropia sp.]